MLELKSVSWRNFMSYGDYISTIDLTSLGQCLITGEVLETEDKDNPIRKSNGAGKSTIPSVIQWVLFGRTMHSPSPGGKIVNHFTGKDCWAKVEFKNGDSVTRTRNLDGVNELVFVKDGNETIVTANTLSTIQNQQKQLTRAFNLDWEMFCGSVFFNQYSKPWMEMADQPRKKAIERALHVDRFEYYSKIAKGKLDRIEADANAADLQIQSITSDIERITASIDRLKNSANTFEDGKEARKKELQNVISKIKAEQADMKLPDLDKLKARWAVVAQINKKLGEYRAEANRIASHIAELTGTKNSLERKIGLWTEKSGKICTSCEQPVPKDHIATKIEPLQTELISITTLIAEQTEQHKQIRNTIAKTDQIVTEKYPSMSMQEAEAVHERHAAKTKEIDRLKRQIQNIDTEVNPHEQSITDAQNALTSRGTKLEKIKKDREEKAFLSQHYQYIYRAYNDRAKIKSYVFQEHIPYINERIKHYLDVFGLDIHVELTSALGISSNLWGYEFESGGERKRTDVAFMLAMFDFHEQMYGRQCNVLVLDEVDGRLDDDGIDALINIIKDDLSSKVETILVISHRDLMFDTFPNEIRVVRQDRFSHLRMAV